MRSMLSICEVGGAKVGVNTYFYVPTKHPVDETSLPFIEIGNNCRITEGVIILGHDYSYAVVRSLYHFMPRKCTVTRIGNNCFLGMNSIICQKHQCLMNLNLLKQVYKKLKY